MLGPGRASCGARARSRARASAQQSRQTGCDGLVANLWADEVDVAVHAAGSHDEPLGRNGLGGLIRAQRVVAGGLSGRQQRRGQAEVSGERGGETTSRPPSS